MEDMVAVDDCKDETVVDGDLQIADCREILDALRWSCPWNKCEDRTAPECHKLYCRRNFAPLRNQVCPVLCLCGCHVRTK